MPEEIRQGGLSQSGCKPSRPCNRWRDCHRCAAKRQAKIATAVEKLAEKTGPLRWTILYPDTAGSEALIKARTSWLRSANPEGAIWTVEQSKKTGNLHCNIITPAETQHNISTARQWDQIIEGNPRHVGAYIAKRKQAPTKEAFSGRTSGTSGPLWQILASAQGYPLIQAAVAQYTIDKGAMLEAAYRETLTGSQNNRMKWAEEEIRRAQRAELPPEHYRAIAAKYLPDLLSALTTKSDSRCAPHPLPNPSPEWGGAKSTHQTHQEGILMATPSGYTQTSANGLTSNRSDADRKHQPVGFDTLLRGERPTGGHLPGEGTEWLDAIGF